LPSGCQADRQTPTGGHFIYSQVSSNYPFHGTAEMPYKTNFVKLAPVEVSPCLRADLKKFPSHFLARDSAKRAGSLMQRGNARTEL